MLEKNKLMEFKQHFMYIAQKYIRLPAITKNKELVELLFKLLDTTFQDTLNTKLSIQDTLKVDTNENS